jgi:hypothetical protein
MKTEKERESGEVLDAEFVDVTENTNRPKEGFGRKTVARSRPIAEEVATTLEAVRPAVESVASVASAVGVQSAAEKAEQIAQAAEKAARIARAMPVVADQVEQDTMPLRSGWNRLVRRAKEAGVIGGRREPRVVTHVRRPAKAG